MVGIPSWNTKITSPKPIFSWNLLPNLRIFWIFKLENHPFVHIGGLFPRLQAWQTMESSANNSPQWITAHSVKRQGEKTFLLVNATVSTPWHEHIVHLFWLGHHVYNPQWHGDFCKRSFHLMIHFTNKITYPKPPIAFHSIHSMDKILGIFTNLLP